MGRLQSGSAPLMKDHAPGLDNVIGVVQSARLENGVGVATVRFAKAEDDPEADKIYRKMKDGIIGSVSIGYRTYKSEDLTPKGAKIPVFRAVDWEPHEVSAVGIGADPDAGFRSEESTQFNRCEFISQQRGSAVEEETETSEIVKAELESAKKIRQLAKKNGHSGAFAERMIANGTTAPDDVRAAVLDAVATRSDEQGINSHRAVDDDDGGYARVSMGRTAAQKRVGAIVAGQLESHRHARAHP